MKQLTFSDLLDLYFKLCRTNKTEKVLEMPIYIGDDDELNGIHCAWYCEGIDGTNKEDLAVEMINERSGNFEIKDKAILIS